MNRESERSVRTDGDPARSFAPPAGRRPDFYREPFRVFVYDSLASTNTFLKTSLNSFPDYSAVWAINQTGGRGKFERKWISEPGKDLCFSFILPLENIPGARYPNLTQVTALAVCRVLQSRGLQPVVKWPNDVLVSGKKICGILCETAKRGAAAGAADSMVVGVGININSSPGAPAAMDAPATSFAAETGRAADLREILDELLDAIMPLFLLFKTGGFAPIAGQINERLAYRDATVNLHATGKTHRGAIKGLNAEGALLFDCAQCGLMTIFSGNVSLEKINPDFAAQNSSASPTCLRLK
ncbi:MAG: biotin--[acetyl-CoA-carboxylase] ligase [Kiritimatiellae bacterium]|nr:biotin--[acetyl-CoA-carboxylase] ligase [Kiritimatiellia bacterium]